MYYGLEQQDTYVLKEGIVKTSIILRDGREFNISYIKGPDIISLLKDEVSQYTSAINVNLKMYSFDHLRMYNIDHINTCCSSR